MSALHVSLLDSATMLRRSLRRASRYPSMTIATLAMPVIILLLFAGVFGGTLGTGVGRGARGGGYIDYLAPGILLMTVASGCLTTSVAICVDVTSGIVDRFRSMPISRSALLTGHAVSSMIQTALSTALVIAFALLLGFRPRASALDWLGAIGMLILVTAALTWAAVLIGLVSKAPESASNTPLLIQFLPFVSSAFVPTASMPAGVRWFAAHQPFTPIIEALRALLLSHSPGHNGPIAVAWCVVIGAAGYLAARGRYNRPRTA